VDAQRWLNELRAEFARQNLPPFYAERLVVELSDHLNDYLEDHMSTDAKDLRSVVSRLGTPGGIATVAGREFRRQRFSGRHPVVAFVVLPLLTLPLLWSTTLAGIVAAAALLGFEKGSAAATGPMAEWGNWCLPGIVFGMVFTPIVIASLLFCRMASRAGVGATWSIVACGIIAALGSMAMINVALPTAAEQGHLTLGLGVSAHPSIQQILQFLVPVCIGGWAVWQQSDRKRSVLMG
jgi:hypothetical protein